MTRKMGLGLWVGAMGVVVLGPYTWAEDPKPVPEARQAQILKNHPEADVDKDGKLSRAEMRKFFADQHTTNQGAMPKTRAEKEDAQDRPVGLFSPDPARFLATHPDADTDKDGKLSPPEMRAYAQAHGPELRAEVLKAHPELDTNKDGVLSPEELQAARPKGDLRARVAEMILKKFPAADSDKDGKLAPEEMRAFMQTHGDEVRAEVLKKRPALDRNGDGTLSQDEFVAAMRAAAESSGVKGPRVEMILKRFPEADTNKDGQLSDAELKAFREQRKDPAEKPKAVNKAENKAEKKAAKRGQALPKDGA